MVYEADDQERFQAAGPPPGLAGEHTLASFSTLVESLPGLRRWGFEAAALDLALRQRRVPLHEVLGREPQPVRFVVSTGPQRIDHIREAHPDMRFKLDPTSEWDEALVQRLAELGGVDVVDFKETYTWREASLSAGTDLYRWIVAALPLALIEDPGLNDPQKSAILEPHRGRITWDAPIHSVADVDALPFAPRTLNSKPSRFGSLRGLLDFYDTCAERGIALYGGGQFELGPGRGQIQYLASLFHPDARTTSPPPGTTARSLPPRFPAARCRRRPKRPEFDGCTRRRSVVRLGACRELHPSAPRPERPVPGAAPPVDRQAAAQALRGGDDPARARRGARRRRDRDRGKKHADVSSTPAIREAPVRVEQPAGRIAWPREVRGVHVTMALAGLAGKVDEYVALKAYG